MSAGKVKRKFSFRKSFVSSRKTVFRNCDAVDYSRCLASLYVVVGIERAVFVGTENDSRVVEHEYVLEVRLVACNVGNGAYVVLGFEIVSRHARRKQHRHFISLNGARVAVKLTFLDNSVCKGVFYVHIVPFAACAFDLFSVVACVNTACHGYTLSHRNLAVGAVQRIRNAVHEPKFVSRRNFFGIP